MSYKIFPTIVTEDEDLNKVQRNIEITLDPMVQNPTLDRRLIRNQSMLSVGINVINHGLGRMPLGWNIVDQDGPSVFWSGQNLNQNANMSIWLYSSNNCTISLEVF